MKTNIIVNGLTIPMSHGITISSKQIKTANPLNTFWKSYSIGHYYHNQQKIMVYFNNKNQFAIINQKFLNNSKLIQNA